MKAQNIVLVIALSIVGMACAPTGGLSKKSASTTAASNYSMGTDMSGSSSSVSSGYSSFGSTSAASDNACLSITATSDANATQIVQGIPDENGILTTVAPSGGSVWLFRVQSGSVVEARNCWSDTMAEASADAKSSLCTQYGPRLLSSIGFKKGLAEDFRAVSEPRPCSAQIGVNVRNSESAFANVIATRDLTLGQVNAKVAIAGWTIYAPGEFNIDLSLPKEGCRSANFTRVRLQDGKPGVSSLQVCYSAAASTLTLTFDGVKKAVSTQSLN